MCNPPFYDISEERNELSWRTCSLTKSENEVEGGEIEFLEKMIIESFEYSKNVGLFTTLIGRKKDFWVVRDFLKDLQRKSGVIKNIFEYDMTVGYNVRWLIAWQFY